MKKVFSIFSTLFLFSHQPIALACPGGPGGPGGPTHLIEKLDTNKDALLSKEEVKADKFLSEKFDEIDTNKDAQLSADELEAHHQSHRPPHPPRAPQSESTDASAE